MPRYDSESTSDTDTLSAILTVTHYQADSLRYVNTPSASINSYLSLSTRQNSVLVLRINHRHPLTLDSMTHRGSQYTQLHYV
jgi:hypothetical protein